MDDPREAELLADMWRRSESGWPGGRTGGVPYTAERARQEFQSRRMHGQWVVECRGEIVGYCSLEADPSQPVRAYVGLLNARPDHHGKGVGRRLVRRAVEQAIADGFERVDLDTWPGNLKAMPLYKKCGFFWSPETGVHMANFIPTIVRMPLFGDFFQKHDWYKVQQRELSMAEDVEWWHGVRVFRYVFAADGRQIEVVCDRQAQMVTAVETDEFYVGAWVGAEDLSALQEHTLHYEFRNKQGRPVRVVLRAKGEAGVRVKVNQAFKLDGRRQIAVPFRLPVDLERKRPGEPPHRVIAELTVDGVPVRLGTAVRKREPVEVEYSGQGLAVGKWTTLRIRLRNRLPFAASGTVAAECAACVERGKEKLRFRLSRGGWAAVSLQVRALDAGARRLGLRVMFSPQTARRLAQGSTPPLKAVGRLETAWLRAYEPGVIAVSEDDERREVIAESDRVLLTCNRAGGRVSFTDKAAGWDMANLWMPEVGPPFGSFRPIPDIYDVEVRRADGTVTFVTRPRVDAFADLQVERLLTASSGVVKVRHRLVNRGREAVEPKVRMGGMGGLGDGTFSLPTVRGLVHHRRYGWRDWPMYGELPLKGSDFPETWVALEHEGAVVGTVWEGASEVEVKPDGIPVLTFGPTVVPPGQERELPPVYIVACSGDYKVVRSVWMTFMRPDKPMAPEEQEPVKHAALQGGLSERPAVLAAGRRRLAVEVVSEGRTPLSGTGTLRLPPCVSAAGRRAVPFAVEGLSVEKPVRVPVTVQRAADAPTAAEGELVLSTARQQHRFSVPFVILRARPRNVTLRRDGDCVSVSNGLLKFLVSASHSGACVSLRAAGAELLNCSYPTPRPYWWMNPWHGGLRGTVAPGWDRRMQGVRSAVEEVSVEGSSGLPWGGARVRTDFTHGDFRWLHSEVDYLTVGGSNVLAVLVRARNRTGAPNMWASDTRLEVWPAGKAVRAFLDRNGEVVAYRAGDTGYGQSSDVTWAAFRCAPRVFLAAAGPPGRQASAWLNQVGDGTFSVGIGRSVDLSPPYREQQVVFYLAVCRSLREAHAYRWLGELQQLP
jgi:GNAT superfamily N-acetyltransferase